ncbi:secretory lipase-domain-containing protein [Aspergillus insuetus]
MDRPFNPILFLRGASAPDRIVPPPVYAPLTRGHHLVPWGKPDGPLTPSEDSFYQTPPSWETTSPGTILRYRTLAFPIAAFGLAKVNLEAGSRILYRTTNTFGEPIATVTTILILHNADYTKLLSYQVAQDAADPSCSPAFALQQFSDAGEALALVMPQTEYLFISSALNKGWIVTVPTTLARSQAVLDNIRAALASTSITSMSPHATVAMWGYSGGSLASGWAAELQPSYAPELKIAGAALGGTVPKITPVIDTISKGSSAGLLFAGLQELANEYPSVAQLIRENIIPAKWADFNKTQGALPHGDIFTKPEATKLLDENSMGQHTPSIPLLIYKSTNDEICPVKDTDHLYNTYCSNGADVKYLRDVLSDHTALTITDALLWLVDRLNGVPVRKGGPRAIRTLGRDIVRLLLGFL